MGVVVFIVKQATISDENLSSLSEWLWFCAGWSYLWWGGGPGIHPTQWPRWQSPPPAAAGQGGCVAFDPTPHLSYECCLCACSVTLACQRWRREKQVASLKLKEWWQTCSTLQRFIAWLSSMIHIGSLKVQNKAELTDQKVDIENLSKIKVFHLFISTKCFKCIIYSTMHLSNSHYKIDYVEKLTLDSLSYFEVAAQKEARLLVLPCGVSIRLMVNGSWCARGEKSINSGCCIKRALCLCWGRNYKRYSHDCLFLSWNGSISERARWGHRKTASCSCWGGLASWGERAGVRCLVFLANMHWEVWFWVGGEGGEQAKAYPCFLYSLEVGVGVQLG